MCKTKELKQQQRRRLQKCHSKSEVALLQILSRLFNLVQFIKCWQFFVELNSKRLYWSSGKEKESCGLAFTSSTKRDYRHFHVIVLQWRKKKCTKRHDAHSKLLFSQSKPLLLFCCSHWRRRCHCLNSLLSNRLLNYSISLILLK